MSTVAYLLAILPLMILNAPIGQAKTYDHEKYNKHRDGAYFHYSLEGRQDKVQLDYEDDSLDSKQSWEGAMSQAGLGLTLSNFVQMGISHSFVSMKNTTDGSFQHLGGHSTALNLGLVFAAPVVNFEAGGGVQYSSYEFNGQDVSTYANGVGTFTTLGFEYNLHQQASVFLMHKKMTEKLKATKSDSPLRSINTKGKSIMLGLRLWF